MEPVVYTKPTALWIFIAIIFPLLMAVLSLGILVVEYPSNVVLWSGGTLVLLSTSFMGLIRTRRQRVVLSDEHLEYSFIVVGGKFKKHEIEGCDGLLSPKLRLTDGRHVSLPFIRGICPEVKAWLSA